MVWYPVQWYILFSDTLCSTYSLFYGVPTQMVFLLTGTPLIHPVLWYFLFNGTLFYDIFCSTKHLVQRYSLSRDTPCFTVKTKLPQNTLFGRTYSVCCTAVVQAILTKAISHRHGSKNTITFLELSFNNYNIAFLRHI